MLYSHFTEELLNLQEVIVKKIEKTTRIFCSYYLEYNDKNQIIKRVVSSWDGYTGVR